MGALFKTLRGILSSAGASDAGKVPLLNADGKLDASFISDSATQRGTATAPASGTHSTSASVVFPAPFTTPPFVIPLLKQASIVAANSGAIGTIAVTSVTTTGFSVSINSNVDDQSSEWSISIAPVFDWIALQV